jgi:hypothetical protein
VVLVAVTNDAEHVKAAFEINVYAGPRHAYLMLLLKHITIAACCSKTIAGRINATTKLQASLVAFRGFTIEFGSVLREHTSRKLNNVPL